MPSEPVIVQNIINDFREVIGEGIDPSDNKHLQREYLQQPLVKRQWWWRRPY